MTNPQLSVREMHADDVQSIIGYWQNSPDDHLIGVGVELGKLPDEQTMHSGISSQLDQAPEEKQAYALIWELDGKPVGHSNINQIVFGSHANMHLHIWEMEIRKLGYGQEWVRMSLPFYFTNFELDRLICEPMQTNHGPNNLLPKLGFTHDKDYITIPGSHCYEQKVSRWILSREKFMQG